MRKDKLTKKEKETMIQVREEWLDKIFKYKLTFDEDKARRGIEWLYEFSNLKKPIIIFVDSPLGCQLAQTYVKEIFNDGKPKGTSWRNVGETVESNVWENVRSSVERNVRETVGETVWSNVWENVRRNVWETVGRNVWSSVWENVRSSVWINVWRTVRRNVRSNVRSNVERTVWRTVGENVRSKVWENVWINVGRTVRRNVRRNVRSNVERNVERTVWESVGENVESVRENVERNVRENVERNVERNYERFCSYGCIADYGWNAFYDFFDRIKPDILGRNKQNFYKFKELLNSGIYDMIQLDGLCVACKLPSFLSRDANNRLHSEYKMAISWNDSYGLYFLHGVSFDRKLWKKVINKQMNFKQVMQIENMEQRMIALKYLDPDELLRECRAKLLDESKRGNRLYLIKSQRIRLQPLGEDSAPTEVEGSGVFSQDAYFLRYECPSTGRVYMSSIDSEVGRKGDADECMAWKHRFAIDEYRRLEVES